MQHLSCQFSWSKRKSSWHCELKIEEVIVFSRTVTPELKLRIPNLRGRKKKPLELDEVDWFLTLQLHRNDPKLFNKNVPWLPHTKKKVHQLNIGLSWGGLDQWLTPNFLSFTNTNVCRNACCKSITKYKELYNKRLNFHVLSFLQEKAFYCHLCNTLSLNLASPWRACCLLVRAQFQSSKRREKQFLVLNALTKYFTWNMPLIFYFPK